MFAPMQPAWPFMTVTGRYARPLISKEIKAVDKRTGGLAADLQTLLRSIPGIGATTAALLVAYVGDIRRFDVPEKPVAYVGIDPSFENRDSRS
jgi:transposase